MTTYAKIARRQAFLWTDFGLELARRYFGEETLAKLPRFTRGKHKGQIKGIIEWRKVESGGWCRHNQFGDDVSGYVERRVGKVIDADLYVAEWGKDHGEHVASYVRNNSKYQDETNA